MVLPLQPFLPEPSMRKDSKKLKPDSTPLTSKEESIWPLNTFQINSMPNPPKSEAVQPFPMWPPFQPTETEKSAIC